jgi:hypothetical protein
MVFSRELLASAVAVLVAAVAVQAVSTFSNTTSIRIPGEGQGISKGIATPYPTSIAVSGLGLVNSVTVDLFVCSHNAPSDVYLVLQGPTGAAMVLMARAGGIIPIAGAFGVDLTFDDATDARLPQFAQIFSGTYQVSQYSTLDRNAETLAAPAPSPEFGIDLSLFAGTDPNGDWKLWASDIADQDAGGIFGGLGAQLRRGGAGGGVGSGAVAGNAAADAGRARRPWGRRPTACRRVGARLNRPARTEGRAIPARLTGCGAFSINLHNAPWLTATGRRRFGSLCGAHPSGHGADGPGGRPPCLSCEESVRDPVRDAHLFPCAARLRAR